MIYEFWESKLNPITMLPKETISGVPVFTKKSTQFTQTNLADDPDYISVKNAILSLGISSKKIRRELRERDIDFKIYQSCGTTYYKVVDVDKIEIILESKIGIPEQYICSSDLKKLLGVDTMQLFTLAKRKGWKKTKFKGNVSYYLKSEVLQSGCEALK